MNMQPEVIQDYCNQYVDLAGKFIDCCDRFDSADRKFSSWSGSTRRAIQERIKGERPAFQGLIEIVLSYPKTAKQAAEQTKNLESQLTRLLQ